MARPIVLSNGELHVALNKYGLVHDFYFPYVGLENHSAGHDLRHRVGVWIDGHISWLDEDTGWAFAFAYPHTALIGHTKATNTRLGVLIEFDDTVDAHQSAFLRNIHVVNLRDQPREIRLFMHQAFAIGDSRSNTDTAQYLPDSDALLHYRGRRAFIISGSYNDAPFDQYTVGIFGIEGHESTYRDADDGELGMGNVEHGRVDSVIRFVLPIGAHSSERVHYWIAAGTSMREALYIHKQIKSDGLPDRLHATAAWWHKWLQPGIDIAARLDPKYQETFLHSLMIIKSQIDKRGAVIASTDTTALNYSRDAYAYSWPRDASMVLWPLIRIGYKDEAYRFFEFSRRGLHPSGYLQHKYRADGALGSSWHPYVHDGIMAPPIQEDETALVLFVFAQYYAAFPDIKFLTEFFESFVAPMGDFLASYIDEETGLPRPSYDLWEQQFLTTTFTVSTVYGALVAASGLAELAGDQSRAVSWRTAADDIRLSAHKHLYNADRKALYKGLIVRDGQIIKDPTIDASSVFGAYIFGLFDPHSNEISTSIKTMEAVFDVEHAIGLPRYEDDDYRRTDSSINGNLWFITSLWLAQYHIDQGAADQAHRILDWVQSKTLSTGVIGEQIDPRGGDLISPAPLTWSHAEIISTLLDTITEKD